ncbi:MAG: PIN domain-containing protein [Verrucomicrobia bacterium]|nr:PIN domain-containing protein [Verrucomicrobiota bacterium]
MKYLLDVNTLVALGNGSHTAHPVAERWLERVQKTNATLASCALTELGFVRVSVQAGLLPDIATARRVLAQMKASVDIVLLPDALGIDKLPSYVKTPAQLTDGHLLSLAAVHGAKLATLDSKIPGAERIT